LKEDKYRESGGGKEIIVFFVGVDGGDDVRRFVRRRAIDYRVTRALLPTPPRDCGGVVNVGIPLSV